MLIMQLLKTNVGTYEIPIQLMNSFKISCHVLLSVFVDVIISNYAHLENVEAFWMTANKNVFVVITNTLHF